MNFSTLTPKVWAVLAGFLLLVLLEGFLALTSVKTLAEGDSFAGFSSQGRVFVATADGQMQLNPAKGKYFNQQTFSSNKAENAFRILSVGGSTTYGRPYLQNTSFTAWLKLLLERYAPNTTYDAINAGGISYASYRVRKILDELVDYQPDLLVVYTGHNEFLEARTFADIRQESPANKGLRELLHRSHIYSLLKRAIDKIPQPKSKGGIGEEVVATLEQIGGPELYHRDAEFRKNVIDQYQQEVSSIVKLAKQRNIPLVLCTLPSNLSGVSPFKSEHRAGLSVAELQSWSAALVQAEGLFAERQYDEALKALDAAERIDDQYALLHYRKGQVLAAADRPKEAYLAFVRAKQEDIVPLRALNEFNDILRQVAEEENVSLADVEATFARVSPHGLVGDNLMADHVHPTIEGQQLAAWVILNAATRDGIVPLSSEVWQKKLPDARQYLRDEVTKISDRYRAMGVWGVGRLFFWTGKYPEAYKVLKTAWAEVKDMPEIPYQLGQLELYRGDSEQALIYLQAAIKLKSDDEKIKLALGDAYLMDGQTDRAHQLVQGLSDEARASAAGSSLLGRISISKGRIEEGINSLNNAVQLAPDVASFHRDLAYALLQNRQQGSAGAEYRKFLELSQQLDIEGELTRWLIESQAGDSRL